MKLKQQRVGLYTCYIHFFGVKSLEHLARQNGYKDNINIDMQAGRNLLPKLPVADN